MFKSIFRFLLILLISIAVGIGIFHLIQPSGGIAFRSSTTSFSNSFGDFGGDGGFRGSFNLIGGLFGITGNLILVAIVTFIVVSIRNIFMKQPEPVTIRS